MTERKNGLTYADSGVDIDAGNRLVDLIKPMVRATARPGADAEIGGFGGLFDLKAAGFKDPILVAATDGVGTKLKIAIETGIHSGIGIDLVAMSVNDLVVQGAVPRWIVILVVSRDIMIVSAVIVSWLFDKPVEMKPLMVSKLNTVAQVGFAALVLASLGFGFQPHPYDLILMGLVTIFTLGSVSLYLVEWVRHMSTIEAR